MTGTETGYYQLCLHYTRQYCLNISQRLDWLNYFTIQTEEIWQAPALSSGEKCTKPSLSVITNETVLSPAGHVDTWQLSVDTSQLSVDTSQLSVDTSQLSVDTGQLSVDCGHVTAQCGHVTTQCGHVTA